MRETPSALNVLERGLRVPGGVTLMALKENCDDRGVVTEIFRDEWRLGLRPVQWNVSNSSPNVFRGMHTHLRHVDYLVVTAGEAIAGLHDLRPRSATRGLSMLVRLISDELCLLKIPTGVAHGFFYPCQATVIQAMSHEFDGSDDLCCRWDDPELGLDWPCSNPLLSERDRKAGSLAEVKLAFESVAPA
jgi:dTDP-4-dehydrorhamnose 3,5-epimerase